MENGDHAGQVCMPPPQKKSVAVLNLVSLLLWISLLSCLNSVLSPLELLLMRLVLYSHKVTTCLSGLFAAAPWQAKWVLNERGKVIWLHAVSQTALARIH